MYKFGRLFGDVFLLDAMAFITMEGELFPATLQI